MSFNWPVDRTGLPSVGEPPDEAKVLEREGAVALAVSILWALSGRQFGTVTTTARPCRVPLHSEYRGSVAVTSYVLSWEGDRWLSFPCGCGNRCRAAGPNVVHLPGPVASVTEVKIAGVVVPSNVWAVEGDLLYRREGPWPPQDLNRPAGDVGTWTVTYERGLPVPDGIAQLTGILAKEFVTAINNNGQCRLPRTVTTASRQGVTYRAYDPAVIYANGKTGLPEVDMWLATVNPHHIMAAPTVR
ncbi:head-tail adaptor [Mycobacterium phage LilMcDreamy]|uniref:Head-to-tail adaptor n=1 Tax=Mycobacterium phage LilMcDreamy TaxID=2652422 RepID=A0A5P8D8H1_9CAUD|nr:head-tail adaptor [Mycobacterium phage LilMcDreamy]QFP94639.1 head-to-tail adaptor [Mycobacterium phage LilMcDreamy]